VTPWETRWRRSFRSRRSSKASAGSSTVNSATSGRERQWLYSAEYNLAVLSAPPHKKSVYGRTSVSLLLIWWENDELTETLAGPIWWMGYLPQPQTD
jgi:hypothetical protein